MGRPTGCAEPAITRPYLFRSSDSLTRTNHIGPKTSVKDRQIRGSLEDCCASASDPKIKLRRIWLLRTHSSPKRPHEQQRSGPTGRNCVVKTAKAQSLPQNAPILTEVFGPMWLARGKCLQASDTNGLCYNPDVNDSLDDSTNNFVAQSFFDVNVHARVFDQERAERLG
jgi:hypothetical protein